MRNIYYVAIALLMLASNPFAQQKGMRVLIKENGKDVEVYDHSWALVIGINKYREWPRLDYAVDDAKSVREMLIDKFGFPASRITLLTDEEATLQNMKNALSTIADKSDKNDRVLIYFSGHGQTLDLKGGGQMGFLIPVEGSTKDNKLYATCLPMADVKTLSSLIPAKHILFLVDACYSGLAASTQRGLPRETKLYLKQITTAKGRQIITAGGKGEESEENPEWGHGAFTYKLLEGLDKGLADQDGDGIITSTELAGYLKSRVAQISHNKQTPQFKFLTDDEGEFVFITGTERAPEAPPPAEEPQAKIKVPASTDDMVLVEGGSFEMGSSDGNADEKPVHRVYVDNFYMDKYEVTVAKFKQFIDATAYSTDAEKEGWSYAWSGSAWEKKNGVNWKHDAQGNVQTDLSHPVIHVSWNDAVAYALWAGKRLPTEAEWEYAARGGNKSLRYTYSGSNNIDEVAWYDGNAGGRTHPVGGKRPNELGIYDMSGNVWEWCSDWYDKDYYNSSPERNPQGPNSGTFRVLRGGSWGFRPSNVRAAIRDGDYPAGRRSDIGFRCARTY